MQLWLTIKSFITKRSQNLHFLSPIEMEAFVRKQSCCLLKGDIVFSSKFSLPEENQNKVQSCIRQCSAGDADSWWHCIGKFKRSRTFSMISHWTTLNLLGQSVSCLLANLYCYLIFNFWVKCSCSDQQFSDTIFNLLYLCTCILYTTLYRQ